MRHLLIFISLISIFRFGFSQSIPEIQPPDHIKTIIFKGEDNHQFPIVKLGDPVFLEFDDLNADESDYYYKIRHCDYNWNPSNLLKSQYLKGIDDVRIINYQNSYNTLQPYSNYKLQIPNDQTRLKLTGNYVLEIYNSYDELQFSRRFVIYKELVQADVTIKRARDFNYINTKQVVQFEIDSPDFQLINPKQEVKVTIIQNSNWKTTVQNIKPQFTIGSKLIYRYDAETGFFAGNEYLNFDTKDIRVASSFVKIVDQQSLFHHYLYPNSGRFNEPYTYFPDINGDFQVRTLQGDDSSIESDYSFVHFTLNAPQTLDPQDIYIYGKFNNYELTDENKLAYNPETGIYSKSILLKQGFYNYRYAIKQKDGSVDSNSIGGNFHATENDYLILVYYRNLGDLYDSIIGYGQENSTTISN